MGKRVNGGKQGKRGAVWLLCLVLLANLSLAGCATIPEEQKGKAAGAAVGAGAGAALGAIIGSGSGSAGRGALLGGIIGGLAGALIGDYIYERQRSAQETSKQYAYSGSQGTLVRIERAGVSPVEARPGQRLDLSVTYAVLDPDPKATIAVREVREIRSGQELIGRPEVTVRREGGTYTSTVPLVLPQDAQKGAYRVSTSIEAGNAKDTRETTFRVN